MKTIWLMLVILALLPPAILAETDATGVASSEDPAETSKGPPAPVVRQFAYVDTQSNFGTEVLKVRFPSPTLAGSAIFAWSRSAIDGQTENFATFTDNRGNTYVPTGDRQSDPDGRVNAAQATAYAANVAAGTSEITATWLPFGDYRSVVIVEVTGVSPTPLLAHTSNIQRTTGSGIDNITSGKVYVGTGKALVLSISSNESQTALLPIAPLAGTGMTSLGVTTDYGPGGGIYTRLAYRLSGGPGMTQARYSALGADEFLTFMVVFK